MSNQLVVFTLNTQHYALPLARVQRVVRTMEITPLPKAPEIVLGVVDIQGSIIPVMSMRKRFGMAEPEINLSDQLVVADTSARRVALLVNTVIGIVERPKGEITEAEKIVPGTQYVEGIAQLKEGILFIHDLERFLSPQEERQLDGLLAHSAGKT
jgi:purine-binding chemotaxis protein CheW